MSFTSHIGEHRPVTQERRRHPRLRIEHIAYADFGNDNGGILIDLSEGGLSFQVVGVVHQGDRVHCKITLPDTKIRIEATGEVVWTTDSGKGGGLRFIDMPETARMLLSDWIAHNINSPGGAQAAEAAQGPRRIAPAPMPPMPGLDEASRDDAPTIVSGRTYGKPGQLPAAESAAPTPAVPAPVTPAGAAPAPPATVNASPVSALPPRAAAPSPSPSQPGAIADVIARVSAVMETAVKAKTAATPNAGEVSDGSGKPSDAPAVAENPPTPMRATAAIDSAPAVAPQPPIESTESANSANSTSQTESQPPPASPAGAVPALSASDIEDLIAWVSLTPPLPTVTESGVDVPIDIQWEGIPRMAESAAPDSARREKPDQPSAPDAYDAEVATRPASTAPRANSPVPQTMSAVPAPQNLSDSPATAPAAGEGRAAARQAIQPPPAIAAATAPVAPAAAAPAAPTTADPVPDAPVRAKDPFNMFGQADIATASEPEPGPFCFSNDVLFKGAPAIIQRRESRRTSRTSKIAIVAISACIVLITFAMGVHMARGSGDTTSPGSDLSAAPQLPPSQPAKPFQVFATDLNNNQWILANGDQSSVPGTSRLAPGATEPANSSAPASAQDGAALPSRPTNSPSGTAAVQAPAPASGNAAAARNNPSSSGPGFSGALNMQTPHPAANAAQGQPDLAAPSLGNGELPPVTSLEVRVTQAVPEAPKAAPAASFQGAVLVEHVDPVYPIAARNQNVEGAVEVKAHIATDGVPHVLNVVSGDPRLVQAALDAISQWRYRPALRDGQPTDSETTITISFRLRR